jgi:hypothetical protein
MNGGRSPTPALERPPTAAQRRGNAASGQPAERQADAIGTRIAADLGATPSPTSGHVPDDVRTVAESHVRVSLSGAEIRADRAANQRAAGLSALAVTEGSTISFANGELSTGSSEGRELLGHELVHVAQQRVHGFTAPQLQSDTGGVGGAGGASGMERNLGAEGSSGQAEPTHLRDLDEAGRIRAIAVMLGGAPTGGGSGAGGAGGRGGGAGGMSGSGGTGGAGGMGGVEVAREGPYDFSIGTAWASFGADLNRIARENPTLWERSFPFIADVPEVKALSEKFPQAVLGVARKNVEVNRKWATDEIASIGGGVGQSVEPGQRSEEQKQRIEGMKKLAGAVQVAQAALQQLRSITVYDGDAIASGIEASSHPSNQFQQFDPNHPLADRPERPSEPKDEAPAPAAPAVPMLQLPIVAMMRPAAPEAPTEMADFDTSLGAEPTIVGGTLSTDRAHNWRDVKAQWDLLNARIIDATRDAPGVFSLIAHEKIDQFVDADNDAAFVLLNDTLNSALTNLEKLNAGLGSDIDWYDLTAIHEQLLNGGSMVDGTDWSSPSARAAARHVLEGHEAREFWIALGITAGVALLVFTGAIFVAGAPLAVALQLGTAAAAGASVGAELASTQQKFKAADAKDSAKKATVANQAGFVTNGGADDRIAALLGLAFTVLGAVISLPRGVGVARVAFLETDLGKKWARAALNRSLKRLAAKSALSESELAVFGARIEWQGHHLVPLELVGDEPLVRAAVRAGYDINSRSAAMLLPSVEVTEAQWAKMVGEGVRLPTHLGGHAKYTAGVRRLIQREWIAIEQSAREAGLTMVDVEAQHPEILMDAMSRIEGSARRSVETWVTSKGPFLE